MKMQQLESVCGAARGDFFDQLHEFRNGDAEFRPVAGFFNSFAKGSVERGYAGTKQILKTDEKRKLNSLLTQILNDFINVDADRIAQDRPYCEVTFFIHIEVGFTPQLDSVKILRIFDGPDIFLRYLFRHRRIRKFAD